VIVDPGRPPTAEDGGAQTPTPPPTGVTILADGVVQAGQPPLILSFEASGKLLELHVRTGDRVQSGDLIATLDDAALQDALTNATLQAAQAENGLAQARLTLDDLLSWTPDEAAMATAQANLEAAEARYERALSQDAAAGYSVTPARISLDQAQQALADAQEAYDNAWDEARDWETFYEERICYEGQGGLAPCTGPRWKDRIEAEREGTARGLKAAQDSLTVAQANYNLALAGLSDTAALEAEAALVSARQALEQATTGPRESEVDAAQLRVEQAEIALEQGLFSKRQAEEALARAQLVAPRGGRVLSVDVAVGATVGPGTPIVALLDTDQLEFHTTNLSERDLTQIAPGQRAVATLKAYPNDPIEATVVRIGLQPGTPVGDAATFPVVLALGDTDLELRPGLTGRVEIRSGD
jgi:multidrug efflux pump subunit AcrA (membrane-fusion protein)